jgi:hypothetical protein
MIGEDQKEISSLPEFIVDVVETLNHLIAFTITQIKRIVVGKKARIRKGFTVAPLFQRIVDGRSYHFHYLLPFL